MRLRSGLQLLGPRRHRAGLRLSGHTERAVLVPDLRSGDDVPDRAGQRRRDVRCERVGSLRHVRLGEVTRERAAPPARASVSTRRLAMTRTHRGAGGRRSGTSSRLSVSVMANRIIEEPVARSLQVRSPDASSGRVHPWACMDEPFILYGRAHHRVARTHVMRRMAPSLGPVTPSRGGAQPFP